MNWICTEAHNEIKCFFFQWERSLSSWVTAAVTCRTTSLAAAAPQEVSSKLQLPPT